MLVDHIFWRFTLLPTPTSGDLIFIEKDPETVGVKVLKHVLRAEVRGRR